MRLQFSLDKITLSATCHIQILRHAEEYLNRYAAGQLYGELYNDIAHITNILTFPEPEQMSTKQQLQSMEVRHRQMLNTFNLDNTNLGWFMVSYNQNYWDSLEAVKYYEKYINTSFFLVFDYQARNLGKNPYKGFRLTDEFIGKQSFSFSEILKSPNAETPFMEIPVQIQKNELFQVLMLFNRRDMVKQMRKKHENKVQKSLVGQKIERYMQTLEQLTEGNKSMAEKMNKEKDVAEFSQYCHYLSANLKASKQEETLKKYEQNLQDLHDKLKND